MKQDRVVTTCKMLAVVIPSLMIFSAFLQLPDHVYNLFVAGGITWTVIMIFHAVLKQTVMKELMDFKRIHDIALHDIHDHVEVYEIDPWMERLSSITDGSHHGVKIGRTKPWFFIVPFTLLLVLGTIKGTIDNWKGNWLFAIINVLVTSLGFYVLFGKKYAWILPFLSEIVHKIGNMMVLIERIRKKS